jgi:hypothetical protein
MANVPDGLGRTVALSKTKKKTPALDRGRSRPGKVPPKRWREVTRGDFAPVGFSLQQEQEQTVS